MWTLLTSERFAQLVRWHFSSLESKVADIIAPWNADDWFPSLLRLWIPIPVNLENYLSVHIDVINYAVYQVLL